MIAYSYDISFAEIEFFSTTQIVTQEIKYVNNHKTYLLLKLLVYSAADPLDGEHPFAGRVVHPRDCRERAFPVLRLPLESLALNSYVCTYILSITFNCFNALAVKYFPCFWQSEKIWIRSLKIFEFSFQISGWVVENSCGLNKTEQLCYLLIKKI